MSFINIVTERIILPVADLLTGLSIRADLSFLMKSQEWSRDQLDEYQNRKLHELIEHAYKNVPYYRELMMNTGLIPADIKSKEDLPKLPIVTKQDLRLAGLKNLATNISAKSYLTSSSSGSTGEPFKYKNSKSAEAFIKAADIRGWYWHDYRLGDRYVKLSMNPRNSFIKQVQDFFNRCRYLSSTQLDEDSFRVTGQAILDYDPKIIRGQPVSLLLLAKFIETRYGKYPGKSLKGINSTGATLHDDTRKIIEGIFKVKIFDSYSCEGGAVFDECPICGLYHPSEEYAISEFIEDSLTFSDPQRPLRHITTDLYNYASPFIRYDSQDYLLLEGSYYDRGCIKPYICAKGIRGRDGDVIITPSGKYLFDGNFAAYFEYLSEVEQIQVIQNQIDQIDINMIVNSQYNDVTQKLILDYWQKYIGSDVSLRVNVVDEIKLTPGGKRRTVIRNPEIKLNA